MNRSWFRSVTTGVAVAAAFAAGIAVPQIAPEPGPSPTPASVGSCTVPPGDSAPIDSRVYDGDSPMPTVRGPLAF